MSETLGDSFPSQNQTVGGSDFPPEEAALEYASISWPIHLAENRDEVLALVFALRCFLEGKWCGRKLLVQLQISRGTDLAGVMK